MVAQALTIYDNITKKRGPVPEQPPQPPAPTLANAPPKVNGNSFE
jgi:hypothetical protein